MFTGMTTCPCGVADSAAAAAARRLPLLRRRLVARFHRDLKQVRRVHLLRRLLEPRPLHEQIVHPVHALDAPPQRDSHERAQRHPRVEPLHAQRRLHLPRCKPGSPPVAL